MTSARYTMARASSLNDALKLKDVALFAVHAEVLTAVDPAKLSFSMNLGEAVWARAPNGVVLVFLHLDVAIEHLDNDQRKELATIGLTFRLTYATETPLAAEAPMSDYVALASWMQTWPYFRAEVQAISSRLGYPALVLPVLLPGQTADTVVREQVSAKEAPKPRTRAKQKRTARLQGRPPMPLTPEAKRRLAETTAVKGGPLFAQPRDKLQNAVSPSPVALRRRVVSADVVRHHVNGRHVVRASQSDDHGAHMSTVSLQKVASLGRVARFA